MNTIIFKVEEKIKNRAQKQAKKAGFSMSDYLRFATRNLAEGRVGMEIVDRPILNEKTRRELIKISKDIKEGKNLSPSFDNVEDMINYLKNC